jgi:phospholipid/cholesterol/gamma-HCH transport system substrate-binding protein
MTADTPRTGTSHMPDLEQKTNFRVGVTVLIALLLLVLGIAWAKGWGLGGAGFTTKAVFVTTGGLEVGDPVTINGVKRGAVSEIELRTNDVLVTLAFDKSVDLRRDARASITMLELMGGKKVDLLTGSSPEKLPPGQPVPGVFAGDISSVVAAVGALSVTMGSISADADTLFTSLNGLLTPEARADLKSAVHEARTTLATINAAASRLNALAAANGPKLTNTLTQADRALTAFSDVLGENRAGIKMFIDSTTRAVAEARSSLARATSVAARLDSLLLDGSKQNSLLYRLMSDDHFATRLDSAVISLTKLSEQIRLQGVDANVRFFNSSNPSK